MVLDIWAFIRITQSIWLSSRLWKSISPQDCNLEHRVADYLFADLPSLCVYIDYILIASETLYEYVTVLEEVFRRVREACVRVSNEVLQPKDTHKNHIIHFSVPQDVKTLRSFPTPCNYFADFILNLSGIAEPLHKLLRKGTPWEWERIRLKPLIISRN